MTQPVFISYARDASRDKAEALHNALGGRTAFLDTKDIAPGERFPEALVDALFKARVVVIFAEPQYFTRWYCLLEFRIARTPFLRAVERPGATAQEKADALRGLVVAMPQRGVDPMMERFPPLVQARNWPAVDDIEAIAALVEAELAANPPTLRERYASVADAEAARSFLLEATRLPPPLRIGAVPFVPQVGLAPTIGDAFVGRADDLWRIHDLLWTERGDPATAAGLTGSIEAIGGFGKTRLALEYLYRFGPRHFKGGLFWINAESDPELQLYDVLQALNPNAPAIEHVRQGSGGVPGAVARAIRARPDETPLFIVDNVPEPEPDQPPRPLDAWCPVIGEVPVLTTSRTRVALGAGGSVIALLVDTLDPDAAVELLTTEIRRDQLDDTEWKHIAEWVGHLPLALEILNRLLRSGEMTPPQLLDLSREQRPSAAVDQAMETIRNVVPEGALRGITEAFSASYNLLTPQEQYAARLIAWMAPAAIPTFVIDAFGPEVFAPGIRAKLRTRSFVTEVRGDFGAYFGTMHRVLADFLRAQSDAQEEEADAVAASLMGIMYSAQGRGTAGAKLVYECAPLATLLFSNWNMASNLQSFTKAWAFANQAGVTLHHHGYAAAASELFASLASASGRRLGDDHPDTIGVRNNWAYTLADRGDWAGAQALQELGFEAMRRVRGNEHPDTLSAAHNLACTLRARGEYLRAQALQEYVLEVSRRTLGDDHPDTLSALSSLAATVHARGDINRATKLYDQLLEVSRHIVGIDESQKLATMADVARARWDWGDYTGARDLTASVYEARRHILGDLHPHTLASLGDLAAVQSELGDPKAQQLQEHLVEATQFTLGDEHPDTLSAISNLAVMLRNHEDYSRAQDLLERVLEARSRLLGEEHPHTVASMSNLAATLQERGDLAGGRDLQLRALAIAVRNLGEEHMVTLSVMNNLAVTYCSLREYERAQELQEQVLELTRRQLGAEHSATSTAAWVLRKIHFARGDAESADRLCREHLLPLLDLDAETLTEQQRRIIADLRTQLGDCDRS